VDHIFLQSNITSFFLSVRGVAIGKKYVIMIIMLSKGDDAMEEGIHCTLSTLMGKQRVSIQDVHSATGLSRNTISSLYHDRATRIDYATLGKLCTFFNCGVSDLLDYTPDE
jgi:putative transcriptional regulator